MFEDALEEKFKGIFGVEKVTYDTPGDSREQKTLFVEIQTPNFHFSDGRVKAMVQGNAVMFGRNEALKFGFFSAAIARAPYALTKDLFFSELEANTLRYRDIVERSFSFVYFFDSQYDPAIGTITEVTINVEEQDS